MASINYFTFLNNRFSIKEFLAISLLGLVSVAIVVLGIANYFEIKHQTETMFKMQMVNDATSIDALLSIAITNTSQQQLSDLLQANTVQILKNMQKVFQVRVVKLDDVYTNAFAFQVYDQQNKQMILRSNNAPSTPLLKKIEGSAFNEIQVQTFDNHTVIWNTFSIKSELTHYLIIVMVRSEFKNQTFLTIFRSTLWDLVALYVFLLIAILFILQVALKPLANISRAIAEKNPRKLEPIAIKTAPPEVIPLLNQLNILFRKFNEVLAKEKRFAGDAAHELKTPLSVIKMQAELALASDDTEVIKQKIRYIMDGSERYTHIIEQLLILSRLEPQQDLPDKTNINLNRIAELQLAELAPKALAKNIDLVLMSSKEKPMIEGSSPLLNVLFRNLIDNAIRYTPENGKVTIYSYVGADKITFEVVDNGVGVPEDKLERIFDRFYRYEGSGQKGSGLGLSIVREIVRLHEGEIHAKLVKKESGLIFEFWFPRSIQLDNTEYKDNK